MIQWVKNPPAMQETQEMRVQFLGWEDPLEKGITTYSSILDWRIPQPKHLRESDTTEWLNSQIHRHTHVQSLNCVQLFAASWTVAHQAPLTMGLSRQEYWSGLPFPSAGDPPDSGIKRESLVLAGGFFTTESPEKPPLLKLVLYNFMVLGAIVNF